MTRTTTRKTSHRFLWLTDVLSGGGGDLLDSMDGLFGASSPFLLLFSRLPCFSPKRLSCPGAGLRLQLCSRSSFLACHTHLRPPSTTATAAPVKGDTSSRPLERSSRDVVGSGCLTAASSVSQLLQSISTPLVFQLFKRLRTEEPGLTGCRRDSRS